MTFLISIFYTILFLIPGLLATMAFFPKHFLFFSKFPKRFLKKESAVTSNADYIAIGNAHPAGIVHSRADLTYISVLAVSFSAAIFAIVNVINTAFGIAAPHKGVLEFIFVMLGLGLLAYLSISRSRSQGLTDRVMAAKDENDDNASDATRANDGSPFFLIILISIASTLWKELFLAPVKYIATAYDYAGIFTKETVPDLGFYTGMASDHANYITKTANAFWQNMEAALSHFDISLFLTTFVYLGFIYILAILFSKSRSQALWATGIMALAPFEIFYTSRSIFGHSLAYLAAFSLFLFYAKPARPTFALVLALCFTMATMYYTSTIANIILCLGFAFILVLEKLWADKDARSIKSLVQKIFADIRFKGFVIIGLLSALLFLAISKDMLNFTNTLITSTPTIQSIASNSSTTVIYDGGILRPYKDANILGISAIRAQALVFVFIGLFGLWRILYKKLWIKNRPAFLAIFPAAIASAAFIYVGYPARAFDYFAFFVLCMPLCVSLAPDLQNGEQKRLPSSKIIIAAAIFLAIALLCFQTMADKRVYFEQSAGEITGAKWITNNIRGTIFSDQVFISRLIRDGYYDVTGSSDTDPRLADLFYNADSSKFKEALASSYADKNIDYLVTTKRMRESYILMLNVPQIPISKNALIDGALPKIYDNGDIRVYEISRP